MDLPLNSPVHKIVAGNEGRSPVEDLRGKAPGCVEDGVVEGAGEGVLAIHGDAVRDDALLRETACQYSCVRTLSMQIFSLHDPLASRCADSSLARVPY